MFSIVFMSNPSKMIITWVFEHLTSKLHKGNTTQPNINLNSNSNTTSHKYVESRDIIQLKFENSTTTKINNDGI